MDKKVLVIDHDPLLRNLISSLLALKDYQPHQATTKEEAFELLAGNHYDLVLLDLMLPDAGGFQLLDHIRTSFKEQVSHTVALTGSDPKFVDSVPHDGICAVLIKPFSSGEFYRVVELCENGGHAAGAFYN